MKSDLRKAQNLHNKSLSDLQRLARLRRIKNYEDMTKKDLIYTLLRSEDNYMKYTNTSTDDELKEKINQIRILLTKLRNTLTNEKKNIIRDELYKIENQERLTKAQKERRLIYLTNLLRHLNNKDKYLHNDYHDLDYLGLRDIEHLFTTIDPSEYYKPILVRTAFKNKYSE